MYISSINLHWEVYRLNKPRVAEGLCCNAMAVFLPSQHPESCHGDLISSHDKQRVVMGDSEFFYERVNTGVWRILIIEWTVHHTDKH